MLSEADVEQQYVHEVLPAKLASDLSYVRHRTLLSDLSVLATTMRIILAKALPGATVSA